MFEVQVRHSPTPGSLPPACSPTMEPGSVENLSIVYQSSDFLVVNKHWDLRIDSKTWRETLTLQKQLRHHFPELADPDTCYGFRYTANTESPTTPSFQRMLGHWTLPQGADQNTTGSSHCCSSAPSQVLPPIGLLHQWGSMCGPE